MFKGLIAEQRWRTRRRRKERGRKGLKRRKIRIRDVKREKARIEKLHLDKCNAISFIRMVAYNGKKVFKDSNVLKKPINVKRYL